MAADVRDTNTDHWLRASSCNPPKNCVEVGWTSSGVIIRDSKSSVTLHPLDEARWAAFVAHCRVIR
jgi:Domain of unknown function (DUF397)